MSYPLVKIANTTIYLVQGQVKYASAFCKDDDYQVLPGTTWTAQSRGSCLVTEITARAKTPKGVIVATSYSSSGTSYSEFAVIDIDDNTFEVTRRTTRGDEKPADHIEPTQEQK